MIIECPACATRYEVPDAAIGSEGRKVRCAKCRHSWHATGIDEVAQDETPLAEPALPADDEPTVEPAEPIAAAGATVQAPAPAAAAPVETRAAVPEDVPTPERHEPAVMPGQSRRYWLWALAIVVLMAAAAALAVLLWGAPAWMPGSSDDFALEAPPELVLDFPREQQGPRQLPNGTEIFGASGTITNAGDTTRRVPPILIVLRDSHERIVYSWEVAPPKSSLAPGESVAVNEAVTDAPRSAQFADIGWKPG